MKKDPVNERNCWRLDKGALFLPFQNRVGGVLPSCEMVKCEKCSRNVIENWTPVILLCPSLSEIHNCWGKKKV